MGYSNVVSDVLGVISMVREQYYSELSEAVIVALFDLKPLKMSSGKEVFGKISLIGEKERALGLHGDVLVVVSKDYWVGASEEMREAFVDHQLAHIVKKESKKGKVTYRLRFGDVTEFFDIARRRGVWTGCLKYLNELLTAHEEKRDKAVYVEEEVLKEEVTNELCEDV